MSEFTRKTQYYVFLNSIGHEYDDDLALEILNDKVPASWTAEPYAMGRGRYIRNRGMVILSPEYREWKKRQK